jgi:type VI secretion system secreted protein Hcp
MASANMFVKIDGVKGETTDKGHKDEIEMLGFSHGISQPTSSSRSSAGGATTERCIHQDFNFTKMMDLSTCDLIQYCCSGKSIKTVTVSCYRADDSGKDILYIKYTMKKCIVSSISVGGSGDTPTENISLNYASIEWDYTQQKEGGGSAGKKAAQWNLETNTEK